MKINAYDVAIPTGQNDGFRFSMDPEKVIASLDHVIEGIRSGRLIPQRASFETAARADEYPMSYIHLVFFDKDAAE